MSGSVWTDGRAAHAAFVAIAAALLLGATAHRADARIAYVMTSSWHVPFMTEPYEPLSSEAPRINHVNTDGSGRALVIEGAVAPSYSSDGTRLGFIQVRASKPPSLVVAEAGGGNARRLSTVNVVTRASWSPDGSRLVFSSRDGLRSIRADGRGVRRLTRGQWDRDPAWGPDGRIAFSRRARGLNRIYVMSSDGSEVRQLTAGATSDARPSWSPDGSMIAFEGESIDRVDVFTIPADGGLVRPVTSAAADEANRSPAWSPDGTAIAHSAWGPFGNDSEIVVTRLAGGAQTRLTDNRTDDLEPTWSEAPLPASEATRALSATLAGVRATAAKRPLRGRRRPIAGLRTWLGLAGGAGPEGCSAGSPWAPVPPWYRGPFVTVSSSQLFWTRDVADWTWFETYHAARLQTGTSGLLCLYGFADPRSTRRVLVRLTRPDGTSTALRAKDEVPVPVARWVALPGRTGRYEVSATQGGRSAGTSFTVVHADAPHMLMLSRSEPVGPPVRLGRTMRVVVTGLPPGARFALDLYRYTTSVRSRLPGFAYFNTVDLQAGADGTKIFRFRTSRRDRPGSYRLTLRLQRRSLDVAQFTMIR